ADYFRAMRADPIRGRVFKDSTEPEIVVSQSFARNQWPASDAIGKRLRIVHGRSPELWMTVVGIVPNIQHNISVPADLTPLFYLTITRAPQRQIFIVARTHVPPATLGEIFRREIQAIDSELPVYNIQTLEQRVAESRLDVGAFSALFTIFALIALALA